MVGGGVGGGRGESARCGYPLGVAWTGVGLEYECNGGITNILPLKVGWSALLHVYLAKSTVKAA